MSWRKTVSTLRLNSAPSLITAESSQRTTGLLLNLLPEITARNTNLVQRQFIKAVLNELLVMPRIFYVRCNKAIKWTIPLSSDQWKIFSWTNFYMHGAKRCKRKHGAAWRRKQVTHHGQEWGLSRCGSGRWILQTRSGLVLTLSGYNP